MDFSGIDAVDDFLEELVKKQFKKNPVQFGKQLKRKQMKVNNNNRSSLSERSIQLLGYICIALVILLYSALYFNNTQPYSDGWFEMYAALWAKGKVPYKDFHYYLSPLNLLIDFVFYKLSFGYHIIFRVFYLLQRIGLYFLIYKLLCKIFPYKYAMISCAISSILCTADAFDYFGDYNQSCSLLVALLAFFMMRFSECMEYKGRIKNLWWGGIIVGLMFLCKPTVFAATLIVFLSVFVLYCITDDEKDKLLKYIGITVAGCMIPLIITGLYLGVNGAIPEYINQVFLSVDGKGSIIDILCTYFFRTMQNGSAWVLAILLSLFFYKETEKCNWRVRAGIFVAMAILVVESVSLESISTMIELPLHSKIIGFLILCIMIAVILMRVYSKKNNLSNIWELITLILCCGICLCSCIVALSHEAHQSVYNLGLFDLVSAVLNEVLFYYSIFELFNLISAKIRNKDKRDKIRDMLIMFITSGVVIVYATTMASGGDKIASNSMRITMPLMLTLLMTRAAKRKRMINRAFSVCSGVFLTVLIMACIAQKCVSPYPWWGMYDGPKEKRIYSTDLKYLKGIKLSREDREMYESISQIILDNTDEDDIIFGYPYIKCFNHICNRYNDYFVPVFWYDVVGDKYVDILLQEIKDNNPKIVLWKEIQGALETHEAIYRKGELLHQRNIEEYFSGILPEKYDYKGKYNGIDVYVMKQEDY